MYDYPPSILMYFFYLLSGLVAKIEKNLSDHTEFLNYKNEMDAWIEKAQHILDGCNGEGDIQQITQQIETVNVSCCYFYEKN